jgi:HSP20 family protein
MALVKRARPDMVDLVRRYFETDLFDRSWLRVEEYQDEGTLVVRAELPGIDPDKDVEISVADDVLTIRAERKEESEHKEKDSYRSEFRYGSFLREFALPAGSREAEVTATYRDGVLEVRVPMGTVEKAPGVTIPVNRG